MADMTPDQVLADEQAVLGKDLGLMYNVIKNNIFWIQIKWKEYKTLFCKPDSIEVINKTVPFYFYLMQQIMIDDIIIHINKLVSRKGKTFKYLSIQRLPDLVSLKHKIEIKKLVEDAITKSKFTNDRRNRYIAHYSLELALKPKSNPLSVIKNEDIENSIDALFNIIKYFTNNIFNSGIIKDVVYPLENANALIRRLKKTI